MLRRALIYSRFLELVYTILGILRIRLGQSFAPLTIFGMLNLRRNLKLKTTKLNTTAWLSIGFIQSNGETILIFNMKWM
jgi:hypothetical protein